MKSRAYTHKRKRSKLTPILLIAVWTIISLMVVYEQVHAHWGAELGIDETQWENYEAVRNEASDPTFSFSFRTAYEPDPTSFHGNLYNEEEQAANPIQIVYDIGATQYTTGLYASLHTGSGYYDYTWYVKNDATGTIVYSEVLGNDLTNFQTPTTILYKPDLDVVEFYILDVVKYSVDTSTITDKSTISLDRMQNLSGGNEVREAYSTSSLTPLSSPELSVDAITKSGGKYTVETATWGDGGKLATYKVKYEDLTYPVDGTNIDWYNDGVLIPKTDYSMYNFVNAVDSVDNSNYGEFIFEMDMPAYDTTYPLEMKLEQYANTVTYHYNMFVDVITSPTTYTPTDPTLQLMIAGGYTNLVPDKNGYIKIELAYRSHKTFKDPITKEDITFPESMRDRVVIESFTRSNENDMTNSGYIEFKFIPFEDSYQFIYLDSATEIVEPEYMTSINYSPTIPLADEFGHFTKSDATDPTDTIWGFHIPNEQQIYYTNKNNEVRLWIEYAFRWDNPESESDVIQANTEIMPNIGWEILEHKIYTVGQYDDNAGAFLVRLSPFDYLKEYNIRLKYYDNDWLGGTGYRYMGHNYFRIGRINTENKLDPYEWTYTDPDGNDQVVNTDGMNLDMEYMISDTTNGVMTSFRNVWGEFKGIFGQWTIPIMFIIVIMLIPMSNRKTK